MGGPNHPKLDCLVFDHWNPCFWGIPHFRKPPYLQNTIKHRYTKCPKTNIERSSIKPNQKDRQGQRFFATRNHFFLEGKAEKKGRTTKKIHLIKKGTPDPGKKKKNRKKTRKKKHVYKWKQRHRWRSTVLASSWFSISSCVLASSWLSIPRQR